MHFIYFYLGIAAFAFAVAYFVHMVAFYAALVSWKKGISMGAVLPNGLYLSILTMLGFVFMALAFEWH